MLHKRLTKTPSVLRAQLTRLTLFVLLGWLGPLTLLAQQPGLLPSTLVRDDVEVRTAQVPLAEWNEALRNAGMPEIENNDPLLARSGFVTVTYEVPIPGKRMDLFDRKRLSPMPSVEYLRVVEQSLADQHTSMATCSGASDATTCLAGLTTADNITLTGGSLFIPPDSHGAAGLNHICHVVNVSIDCTDKTTGTSVTGFPASLASFFSGLGASGPATATFDPKIVYDHFEDRFVVITLERLTSPSNASYLFVAVSDDGDPTGTWTLHRQDVQRTLSGNDCWFDYPGFSVDDDVIYVTGNMFRFSDNAFCSGVELVIVEKGAGASGFYDGNAAVVRRFDVGTLVPGAIASTMQPALMFGEPPAPPAPATEVGTFLTMYSGLSNGTTESLQVIRIDDPLSMTPTANRQLINVGDIDNTAASLPNAPQMDDGAGAPTAIDIETNDRRALDAVWRSDHLYLTAQVVPGSGTDMGQVTARWFDFNTSTLAAVTSSDGGNLGGEDIATGAHTFFPSVAVNSALELAFGFSASVGTMFAGAYFTGRTPSDAAGTVRSSSTLQAGTATYVRTFGGSRNRWGDYSATVLDPGATTSLTDDYDFWAINQAAITRGNATSGPEDGRWGEFLGLFPSLVRNTTSISGMDGWRLLASPIQSATVDNLLGGYWTQGFTGSDNASATDSNVLTYDESVAGASSMGWTSVASQSSVMQPGKGYGVYFWDDDDPNDPGTQISFPRDLTLVGQENATPFDFSSSLSYTDTGSPQNDGWSLLGNPFRQTFDWDVGVTRSNLDATIYVWDHTTGNYRTWNGIAGTLTNGLVAPFQGFFVKANAASPSLSIAASSLTTGGTIYKGDEESHLIALNLVGATKSTQTFIALRTDASIGKDRWDSFQLTPLVDDYLLLYSASPEGYNLTVNVQPNPLPSQLAIPLHIAASSDQQVELRTTQLNLPEGFEASLYDSVQRTESPLREGSRLTFTIAADASTTAHVDNKPSPLQHTKNNASSTPRFQLLLREATSTDLFQSPTLPTTFQVQNNFPNPFSSSTTIRYGLPTAGEVLVEVFDVIGRNIERTVHTYQEAGWHNQQMPFEGYSTGVYFVRVSFDGHGKTIVVNKTK